MTNEKAVAEKLLQVAAVKLSPEKPFTWASGWKSPIYCDNRIVLSFPFVRDFIKSELCNVVFEHFPQAEILAVYAAGAKRSGNALAIIAARANYLRAVGDNAAALKDYKTLSASLPNFSGYKDLIKELEAKLKP